MCIIYAKLLTAGSHCPGKVNGCNWIETTSYFVFILSFQFFKFHFLLGTAGVSAKWGENLNLEI